MSQPTRKSFLYEAPMLRLIRHDGTRDLKPDGSTAYWLFRNLVDDLGSKEVCQRLMVTGEYLALYHARQEAGA